MSLTDIQKVKLEIGLTSAAFDIPPVSDAEIQYFLDKNSGSIRRASLDAAKTLLFILSSKVHERVDELEIWGDQAARNYMDALKMYINNPNYSIANNSALPYAGGISKSEITANLNDSDAQVVKVDRSLETDDYSGDNPFAQNVNQDYF